MFTHDRKCVQNHFCKNVENENFYFIFECIFELIANKNENAFTWFWSNETNTRCLWKMLLRLCKHHDKWIRIKFIFDKHKMFWMMKLMYEFIFKYVQFETQLSWKNITRNFNFLWFNINKTLNIKKHSLRTKFMNDWIAHWMVYQVKTAFPSFAQIETLSKKN